MTMPLEATGAAHACPAPAVSPAQHGGHRTAHHTTHGEPDQCTGHAAGCTPEGFWFKLGSKSGCELSSMH